MCLPYNRLINLLYQSHPFALLLLMVMALLSMWTAKLETKVIFTFSSIRSFALKVLLILSLNTQTFPLLIITVSNLDLP